MIRQTTARAKLIKKDFEDSHQKLIGSICRDDGTLNIKENNNYFKVKDKP